MEDSDVPVHRSWKRSVVDEESDTVHVMTIDGQRTYSHSVLRSGLRSIIETAPIREVLGELETPVAVVQLTFASRMRYGLNCNSDIVYEAMRGDHQNRMNNVHHTAEGEGGNP